jgi:hypothetical protein
VSLQQTQLLPPPASAVDPASSPFPDDGFDLALNRSIHYLRLQRLHSLPMHISNTRIQARNGL